MTSHGLLGEPQNDTQASLDVPQILDLCDRIVGEIGRRAHMFGWLRASDGERWLSVEAYYPSNRLVVVCREHSGPDDDLYSERVPAHGMRLLATSPAELGADRDRAQAVLKQRIADLGPPPRRPHETPVELTGSVVARAVASLATPAAPRPSPVPLGAETGTSAHDQRQRRVGQTQAEAAKRAARFVSTRPSGPARRAPRPHAPLSPAAVEREAAGARVASARAAEIVERLLGPKEKRAAAIRQPRSPGRQALGATLGVALVVVLAAEVYLGVGKFALAGGHVLLTFGLALDACARALGTVAAGRLGDQSSAWWCAIGGSPFVVGFALFAPSGPVTVEPAPLAGFVALFANSFVALWLVGAMLGI
jgi:hypothetical protein